MYCICLLAYIDVGSKYKLCIRVNIWLSLAIATITSVIIT